MKPKISVCCLCYNHSEYLATALESFLMQEGDFDLEIVIFDDCSTDNSRDIILDFHQKYPETFKIIFPEKNIYQQGRTAYYDIITKASGDFLAFCEGDDYWLSNQKLTKQLNFLNEHPDTNLVFHPAYTLVVDGNVVDNGYGEYAITQQHSFKNILSVSGGYMPMAAIFARRSAYSTWFEKYPDFFSKSTWHSTIQILGAYTGGAGYLPEKLSVYRSMHVGSWTHTISRSSTAVVKDFESFCVRNRTLNEITSYEFEVIFDRVLLNRVFRLAKNRNLTFKQKAKQYRSVPYKFTMLNTVKYKTLCVISEILRYASK